MGPEAHTESEATQVRAKPPVKGLTIKNRFTGTLIELNILRVIGQVEIMTGNTKILGRPIPGVLKIIKILETIGTPEIGTTEVAGTGTRKITRGDTEKGVGAR